MRLSSDPEGGSRAVGVFRDGCPGGGGQEPDCTDTRFTAAPAGHTGVQSGASRGRPTQRPAHHQGQPQATMFVFWIVWISLVLGGLAGVFCYREVLGRRLHLERVPVPAHSPARQRVSPGREAGLALRELPVSPFHALAPWPTRSGRGRPGIT